ncbi:DUF948 domain-containing protein [Oceanobacillus piezotolerans]|uniref:DUF948 domain-containing protein n=1 Tax=Oceanobacillus piezotolerans TaxID=2448030 RepID=A0A498D428_9BACI|nr:DUF948 domain-containing protein [Oceanobacillus piezotolerans]RLL39947.1 DUF948 domain-containing protein [Oceanobacillus piezotolerans]
MEVIYFGILLCSIAFFIAVIYLSIVLRRVADVTRSLGYTLKDVEKQFNYITPALIQTIRETEKTVDEMGANLKATDSVFDSIHQVGESINNVNQTFKQYSDNMTEESFRKQIKPFVEGIRWGEAVLQVYSKWKKVN